MSTTHVTVYVGGAPYRAGFDSAGVLRFEKSWVLDAAGLDLNRLSLDYQLKHRADPAALRAYAETMMGLGYSCSGFCDLSNFAELEVRAPTWVRNGSRPWERVELEQVNTQRTLARLMKTLWDCALCGSPTPAQLKAYERARRPMPGDLVLEITMGVRRELFEGTGRLILAREERPEGGDEDSTELVWYVEQLDGRLARWRNATFIAAPIEPTDDPKSWALEAANRHELGKGLPFSLYSAIYESTGWPGGWS
jgi:hypothetical protein